MAAQFFVPMRIAKEDIHNALSKTIPEAAAPVQRFSFFSLRKPIGLRRRIGGRGILKFRCRTTTSAAEPSIGAMSRR